MAKRGIGAYTEVGDEENSLGLRMVGEDGMILNIEISPSGEIDVYVFSRDDERIVAQWGAEIDDMPLEAMARFLRPDLFTGEDEESTWEPLVDTTKLHRFVPSGVLTEPSLCMHCGLSYPGGMHRDPVKTGETIVINGVELHWYQWPEQTPVGQEMAGSCTVCGLSYDAGAHRGV